MNNLKVFFVVIGCIIVLGVLFYFSQLYYFFYQDVMKTENSILRHQFPLLMPNGKEDYVSTWGAFGDFIGGTLNPIIGLISIILLFATWFVTYQTLKVSREELSKSTKALKDNADTQKEIQKNQSLQQFDSFFFSLLSQIRDYEKEIFKDDNLDRVYEWFFERGHTSVFNSIVELNKKYELNSYFLIVFELLKNIYERVENNNILDDGENIARDYVNIIKVTMPFKLQQLLMLKVCDSKDYRHYFVRYGFFDKTPFYNLLRENGLLSLLAISLVFKYKNLYVEDVSVKGIDAFKDSVYLRELKKAPLFSHLFELNNFQEIFLNGNGVSQKIVPYGKYIVVNFQDNFATKEVKINFTNSGIDISLISLSYEKISKNFEYSELEFFYDHFIIQLDSYKFNFYHENSILKVEQSYNNRDYICSSSISIK